jgi:hypothetical protein
MKKFESNYNCLDVLNIADYIPCFLNRQVIIILSTLGIGDESFEKLLDQSLQEMSSLLVENQVAIDFLSRYYRPIVSMPVSFSQLKYKFEPFFRDLLLTIHQKLLQDLISKSRIFVPKGRIIMGAIDETGTLKENEIFIQCKYGSFDKPCTYEGTINDKQAKMFIVNTQVAVAKNPCMHAGDVRTLNAVDNPLLHHMIDCVVFPLVGKRPITNMCSGSDLDGDLYFVTWEPSLVPKLDRLEKPMDYDTALAKEQDEPIKIEQVIEFFVNFIKVDQLGRIANTHVAISDNSADGVKDKRCIKLAELFSKAVDFPKTGAVIEFPTDCRVPSYPDFMEKKDSEWYISKKIIGKMYRKCKKLTSYESDTEIVLNPSFVIEGHEQFLPEAIDTYLKYRQEIERILVCFDCKTESQLFVGFNLNEKSYEAKDSFKQSSSVITKLWEKMRHTFTDQLKAEKISLGSNLKTIEKLTYQKASAWYVAAYTHESNKNTRIISFPWIIEDILNKFAIKNCDFFSKSIVENYLKRRDDFQSMSRFIQKIEIKNELCYQIKENLFLSGSFGLFLFDKHNEIQLLIYKPKKRLNEIKTILENVYDNVSMTSDGQIKCYHNNEHEFVLAECEISFRRFAYMKKMIHSNPLLLPFLYTIIHFARNNGVFQILNSEKIKWEIFVEFCIQFYVKENDLNDLNNSEIEEYISELYANRNTNDCSDTWISFQDQLDEYAQNETNFCENQLGANLLNFYKKNALNESKISFKSKFEENVISEMSELKGNELKSHFFRLFNTLSKSVNIKTLWKIIHDEEDFPVYRSKLKITKISKARSQQLFVENASVFTFSNFQTEYDQVEFEAYKGERRSLHLTKNCWSTRINRSLQGFTKESQNEIYLHVLKQLTKAKEAQQDYSFMFQIKYGNVYFTNIPKMFLEESTSIPLVQLRNALKKGYKNYDINPEGDSGSIRKESENVVAKLSDSDSEDEYEATMPKKKKIDKVLTKKKKHTLGRASSAFDPNISKDISYLNLLFTENEFESESSETYIVYLELKNSNNQVNCYRLKYNFNLVLQRVETMPISWISIDVRNTSNENSKDIRFSLKSDKEIDLNECNFSPQIIDRIKNGVFKIIDEKIMVDEQFRDSDVFIKHSKKIKYNGGIEHWQNIFNLVKMQPPKAFPIYMLEKIKFSLMDTSEYSENDQQGNFTVTSHRKEFNVYLKFDIKAFKNSDCKDAAIVLWFIAMVFSKILE